MIDDALVALSPLKVIIATETTVGPNDELAPYLTAVTRAFQGGFTQAADGSDRYYAGGSELGVDVRRMAFDRWTADAAHPASDWAQQQVENFVARGGCLLIVALLQAAVSPKSKMGEWLEWVAGAARNPAMGDRIGILPIAFTPQVDQLQLNEFNEFQRLPSSELGEFALRPGNLGLLVLQRAWTLLGTDPYGRLKLFISHAKRDGAPVALSLKSQIESLRFLSRFYDAADILPGTQWRRVLKNGVRESILVALRTDIYEQRAWCLQEFDWAEEFGCPCVIVDVRQANQMSRETLPVADLPTVKICDGNLVRVLNTALREAVRLRLFERIVTLLADAQVLDLDETLVVHRVSLSALGSACQKRRDEAPVKTVTKVVIPDPFRESLRGVAENLVRAYFPQAMLGVPRTFL